PPLLADHRDVERILRRLGQLEERVDGEDGDASQEDAWQDRPHHLEPRRTVDLFGHIALVALLPPEAHHDEGGDQDDEDTDHTGDDEHRDLKVLDQLRLVPLRLERVERGVLGTARDDEGEHGQSEGSPPAPPAPRVVRSRHCWHGTRTDRALPNALYTGGHGTVILPAMTPTLSPAWAR